MQETLVWFLGWEDLLEKGKATHASILAWKIPRTVKSMESQRVRHDWVTCTFTFHFQTPLHEFNNDIKLLEFYHNSLILLAIIDNLEMKKSWWWWNPAFAIQHHCQLHTGFVAGGTMFISMFGPFQCLLSRAGLAIFGLNVYLLCRDGNRKISFLFLFV